MGRHSAVFGTAVLLLLGLLAASCGDDGAGDDGAGAGETGQDSDCPESSTPAPVALATGVILESDDAGSDHVACDPGYGASPPTSGAHFDAWQNCGFYSAPVRDYTAVHALEHGAVWIAYASDTAPADLDAIEATVADGSHLLAAPYPGLANPFVLTAWTRQLAVDSWDDPLVGEFIGDFAGRVSPTAPEAGVSCDGAIGGPPADADLNYEGIRAELLSS